MYCFYGRPVMLMHGHFCAGFLSFQKKNGTLLSKLLVWQSTNLFSQFIIFRISQNCCLFIIFPPQPPTWFYFPNFPQSTVHCNFHNAFQIRFECFKKNMLNILLKRKVSHLPCQMIERNKNTSQPKAWKSMVTICAVSVMGLHHCMIAKWRESHLCISSCFLLNHWKLINYQETFGLMLPVMQLHVYEFIS